MITALQAHALSVAGAFVVLITALALGSWAPFVGAILTYFSLLALWSTGAQRKRPPLLPARPSADDLRTALDAFEVARRELEALSTEAPEADAAIIARMAELITAIRRHHEANPAHLLRTRRFVRQLPALVAAVTGYLDLCRRAGPGAETPGRPDRAADRLAKASSQLAVHVLPVLEEVDRSCLYNDLTALEADLEVLIHQLGRCILYDGRTL